MSYRKASNKQVKLWRKLQQRKYRYKETLFIAEGERCVEQIIDHGKVNVQELILLEGYIAPFWVAKSELPIYQLSSKDFNELSDTESPQGILAVCGLPAEPDIDEILALNGILVALDGIQDPGNLGTIIRTSAWFGVKGLIAGTGTVDPWHPKVVRSTAGSTGALPVFSGDLPDILSSFSEQGWSVLLLDKGEDSMSLTDIRPAAKTILVIGNEANGISSSLSKKGWKTVRIDGAADSVPEPGAESLNAAIALGIALYGLTTGLRA